MNLQTGKLYTITPSKGRHILVSIEVRNLGEVKNVNLVEIQGETTLIFEKAEPKHFNEFLFHVPGMSTNIEIFIDEGSLSECIIIKKENE